MSDYFWLTPAQLKRIEPYFPLSHGVPRVDDLRVVSGIIHVIKRGLQWRDAASDYGPHKTLYNRFVRWSGMGFLIGYSPNWQSGKVFPNSCRLTPHTLKPIAPQPVC